MHEQTSKHIHEYVCTVSLHAHEHQSMCIRNDNSAHIYIPEQPKDPIHRNIHKHHAKMCMMNRRMQDTMLISSTSINKYIYESIRQMIYQIHMRKPLFAHASIKTAWIAHDNHTHISIAKQPKESMQPQIQKNQHARCAWWPKEPQRLCAKAHPCLTTWMTTENLVKHSQWRTKTARA